LFPFGARKWLDQNISNYDVVHISKNWSLLANMTAAAAVKHNVPYVFSAMGFVAIHNRSRLLKQLYKKYLTIPLIRNASACIAVTNEEKDDLINAGAAPEKVHLIPNGIIPENFLYKDDDHFRQKYSLGNRKIMLFIGRMDPIKGVHLIIEAFGKLRDNLEDWCLVLVGTQSAYRKEMERKSVEMGLQYSIIFLDPIFGKEKSEAYHAAEFIVVPSVKDAMTIVAPEAACCAKPVLITNTSDFNELAQCGGAIEVDPTIDSLAQGLDLLTDSKCDRIGMGIKGFEYVVGNYKWEYQAQKYMALFNAVSRPAKA
jgi:glycosyltransferase involved in cell wall biosynthesis